MYADLFDQLGGGRSAAAREASGSRTPEVPPLVAFKAGKVDLDWNADAGTYQCNPSTARGQVRLVWNNDSHVLEWQWMDRREKKVLDTFPIVAAAADETSSAGTFERIVLDTNNSSKTHKDDRIYVWTHAEGAYRMYWMQDANPEQDDEIVAQVNQYLSDPASAAPAGSTATASSSDAATTSTSAAAGTTSPSTLQVDALSSILQNLGMPPADTANATNTPPQPQQLTLADLQGAMAQVQSNTTRSAPGPSLDNLVSPAAITSLLQDSAASARLMELLPPGQQTLEYLEANLRSPQVQGTLRALTSALLPDSQTGATDGLASILANFQLPAPTDPVQAQQNPIQAFLEAIVGQVQQEQGDDNSSGNDGNNNNDDDDSPMAE